MIDVPECAMGAEALAGRALRGGGVEVGTGQQIMRSVSGQDI